MKHLSIIIILILAFVAGCMGLLVASFMTGVAYERENQSELTPEQRSALPYLIENMELARDTHQDIVDNSARNRAWLKGGADHQVWVEIYDEIIEILEAIK